MAILKHLVHEAEDQVSHFRLPVKVAFERHETLFSSVTLRGS